MMRHLQDVDEEIASRGPANFDDLPDTPGAPHNILHPMPTRSVFDIPGYMTWGNVKVDSQKAQPKPVRTKL